MRKTAVALMFTLAAGTASAQTIGQILQGVLVVHAVSQITPVQVQAEVQQEARNAVRAWGGDANAQNLSHMYQIQRQNGTENQPRQGIQQILSTRLW